MNDFSTFVNELDPPYTPRMPTASTATTGARARAPHLGPERRRPLVLDAARAIAVRDGIGAINVQAVAQHLGVTRPVVYACFADRVEIVEALIDRETEALTATMLAALHGTGVDADPEAAFVLGFTGLLTAAAGEPDPWRIVFAGEPDAAVATRFRTARAEMQQHATAWIRPAMERWWQTADLDHKLPVLIELFMSSCESAVRSLLDQGNDWGPSELGAFVGRAVHRAFKDA